MPPLTPERLMWIAAAWGLAFVLAWARWNRRTAMAFMLASMPTVAIMYVVFHFDLPEQLIGPSAGVCLFLGCWVMEWPDYPDWLLMTSAAVGVISGIIWLVALAFTLDNAFTERNAVIASILIPTAVVITLLRPVGIRLANAWQDHRFGEK